MNDVGPNELEERRVIRLLADATADIAPLPERDVDELLRTATGGSVRTVRHRRSVGRQLQRAVAACAAAAVLISGSLVLSSSEPQQAANHSDPSDARLASFPEGSALQLLLSIHANGGNS